MRSEWEKKKTSKNAGGRGRRGKIMEKSGVDPIDRLRKRRTDMSMQQPSKKGKKM